MRRKSKGVEDLYTSRARDAPQKKLWVSYVGLFSHTQVGGIKQTLTEVCNRGLPPIIEGNIFGS